MRASELVRHFYQWGGIGGARPAGWKQWDGLSDDQIGQLLKLLEAKELQDRPSEEPIKAIFIGPGSRSSTEIQIPASEFRSVIDLEDSTSGLTRRFVIFDPCFHGHAIYMAEGMHTKTFSRGFCRIFGFAGMPQKANFWACMPPGPLPHEEDKIMEQIAEEEETLSGQPINCPSCDFAASWNFCGKCGRDLI
jgi:hypothetical protein